MIALLIGCGLLLIGGALHTAIAVDVQVTLNVYSGRVDPAWTVSGSAAAALMSRMPREAFDQFDNAEVARSIPWYRLGYRGFKVTVNLNNNNNNNDVNPINTDVNDTISFVIYNSREAELALLNSANDASKWLVRDDIDDIDIDSTDSIDSFASLSPQLIQQVEFDIDRLAKAKASGNGDGNVDVDADVRATERPRDSDDGKCVLPVRGPDNVTTYGPVTESCGFWTKYVGSNNCYNYGSDIVTNTFAQPGRAAGQRYRSLTCDDVAAAAVRDGLVWLGDIPLPQTNPVEGHYVALVVAPRYDFHWIRLDSVPAGGWWSHKMGGTPVKNVDNNRKPISDPSKGDFRPYSFCGYMTVVPSKVEID